MKTYWYAYEAITGETELSFVTCETRGEAEKIISDIVGNNGACSVSFIIKEQPDPAFLMNSQQQLEAMKRFWNSSCRSVRQSFLVANLKEVWALLGNVIYNFMDGENNG